jgi:repressor LexA
MKYKYTEKQGQYLTYIYNYTKINNRPPSESDIQKYFEVTPPTVHQMVLKLEKNELISRTPGQARSIRVLVPPDNLPYLR